VGSSLIPLCWLISSQIWLIPLVDDLPVDEIRKKKGKKNPDANMQGF
jgi:hypothetical protein